MSALLLLVVFVFAMVVTALIAVIMAMQRDNPNRVPCPYCGKLIVVPRKECPHCKATLVEE